MALAAGCATAPHESDFRRWRAEPVESVFANHPSPELVRVVLPDSDGVEDSSIVLEGARLEADSVIGFRELEDGTWRRIAVPADSSTRIEVLKVRPALIALNVLPLLVLLAAGS